MTGREIITLQVGSFANHIGTHWWNLHESNCYSEDAPRGIFNYDILFQRGENWKREVTFTPRLLLIDGKGALGPTGADYFENLYNNETSSGLSVEKLRRSLNWDGPVDVVSQYGDVQVNQRNDFLKALNEEEDEFETENSEDIDVSCVASSSKSPRVEVFLSSGNSKSKKGKEMPSKSFREQYFDLDDKITNWTDYLKPILHPKSLTTVKEHTNQQSILNCNDAAQNKTPGFESGSEIFSSYWEDLEQNLFYLLEKCDSVQGFQVLSDVYDGIFGGISSSLIESFRDEMPKKSIFTIACCEQPTDDSAVKECFKSNRGTHIVNCVSAISSFLANSACVLPLSLQYDWFPKNLGVAKREFRCFDIKGKCFHQSAVLSGSLHGALAPSYCFGDRFVPLSDYCNLLGEYLMISMKFREVIFFAITAKIFGIFLVISFYCID